VCIIWGKFYTNFKVLRYSGDIILAMGNSKGIVKSNEIKQSATKGPLWGQGSTTIPKGSRIDW